MPNTQGGTNPEGSSGKNPENGSNGVGDKWRALEDVDFAVAEATKESKEDIAAERARERLEAEQKEWSKNDKVLGDEKGLKRVLSGMVVFGKNTFAHIKNDGIVKTVGNAAKFGVFRDVNIGRYANEELKKIEKNGGNVYADMESEDGDMTASQAMAEKIAFAHKQNREHNDNVLSEKEKLKTDFDEKEQSENKGVVDLLRKEVAEEIRKLENSDVTEEKRDEQLGKILADFELGVKNLIGENKFKKGNYGVAAERMADQLYKERLNKHNFSVEELDDFFENHVHFSAGQVEAGLAQKESLATTTEKVMQLGGAAGIAVGAGMVVGGLAAKKGLRTVLRAVGGGAAAGAILGAMSADKRAKREIVAEKKKSALGNEAYGLVEFEEGGYDLLDAEMVSEKLDEMTEELMGNKNSSLSEEDLEKLAEVKARLNLQNTEGIDMFKYNGAEKLEEQKLNLIKSVAGLESMLNKEGLAKLNGNEDGKREDFLVGEAEELLKERILEQEKADKSYRRKKIIEGAMKGAVIGGALGAAGGAVDELTGLGDKINGAANKVSENISFGGEEDVGDEGLPPFESFEKSPAEVIENELGDLNKKAEYWDSEGNLKPEIFKTLDERSDINIEVSEDGDDIDKLVSANTEPQSVQEYIDDNPEEITHINSRRWSGGDISIGNPRIEGDEYVIDVTSRSGMDTDGMEFAMSANVDHQMDVFTADIEDGQIRIPVDDPEASMFSTDDRGVTTFDGRFGEVLNDDGNGNMTVYSTIEGSGVDTIKVPEVTEVHTYNITDVESGNTSKIAMPVEGADLEQLAGGGIVAGESAMVDGEEISNRVLEEGTTYDKNLDVYNLPGKLSSNNLGPSLYDSSKSEAQMFEKLMNGIATSPGQTALWQTAFNMEGGSDVDSVNELNNLANSLAEASSRDYVASMNITQSEILDRMNNGEIESVNFSETPYTKSIYEYPNGGDKTVLQTTPISGNSGHGLRLLDANGNNILMQDESGNDISGNLREIYNVPADQKGEFVVRLDCGGQIVWVPEQGDVTVGETVTGSTGGGNNPGTGGSTPTPTPTPEPEPEPEPTPTPPEPEPEPTPNPKDPGNEQRIVDDAPLEGKVTPTPSDQVGEETSEQTYTEENSQSTEANMIGNDDERAAQEAANEDEITTKNTDKTVEDTVKDLESTGPKKESSSDSSNSSNEANSNNGGGPKSNSSSSSSSGSSNGGGSSSGSSGGGSSGSSSGSGGGSSSSGGGSSSGGSSSSSSGGGGGGSDSGGSHGSSGGGGGGDSGSSNDSHEGGDDE